MDMLSTVAMILILAAFFLAAIMNLAVDSRFRKGLTRFSLVFAAVAGIFFYGYGYAWKRGLNLVSLIQAMFALCRVFVGANDLDTIKEAPLFQYPVVLAVFWLTHFLAYYVMASAAISTIGRKALYRLRATLLRRGPLVLIYGIHAQSVKYGRYLAREWQCSVVFVDQEYNAVFDEDISAFGGVVEKGADALAGNTRFLKQLNIKPGKRRMALVALKADGRENLRYARALLEAMTKSGIRPDQTILVAAGAEKEAASMQAMEGEGYGSVYAFDEYDLTARCAVQDHPPCSLITFDEKGKATEDFRVAIVGFGMTGRAMLARMTVNGQFTGSRFRADVFDPAAKKGYLYHKPMADLYDIRFHDAGGDSEAFYAFLEENLAETRLIILCTESTTENHRIAGDLDGWFPAGQKRPPILLATREDYQWIDENGHETNDPKEKAYPDFVAMDAMAMQVHQIYCEEAGSRDSARENWRKCSYAGRQSNRACADFFPAVLKAAGKTEEQVLAGEWPPEGETMENLARTEHLRWCAYATLEGYSRMPEETWNRRAEQYRQGAEPGFRISVDREKRQHACLVSWEELEELSRKENEATGGQADYQQLDRNNILIMSRAMQARKQAEEDRTHGRISV